MKQQGSENMDNLAKLEHYVTLPTERSLIKARLQKCSTYFDLGSKL